jgi:peptidoglycan hydrolase CwlO-like protein
MELELEEYRKYFPAVLAVFIALSFGYTASVAGQIDENTDPAQVRSIVDEKQQPIIDEFDSVVSGIDSEMEATNSSIDEVGENVSDVNDSLSELREKNQDLEDRVDSLESNLSDTRGNLSELREWASSMGTVSVEDVELLSQQARITVYNNRLDPVEQVLVTAKYENVTHTGIVDEVASGDSEEILVSRPANSSVPEVTLDY